MVAPKGWVVDTHPAEQPDNTYRYALNAVAQLDAGSQSLRTTERGTQSCVNFPGEPVGQVYLTDNEFVVFIAPDEIGLVKNCTYTTVLKDSCLNFSTSSSVDATFRIRNGCERTVYYTDGRNSPRVINLEQPACESLFTTELPVDATSTVQAGGNLTQGSYQIAVRYLDSDSNPSNWSYYAGPYVIYSGGNYVAANGEFAPSSRPAETIPNSNKSIRVALSSPTLPFYQVALGISDTSSGSIDRVLISRVTPVAQATVISGNFDSWTEGLIEDVFVDRQVIALAKHIEQIENRLVLSNVTENQRPYCDYQSFANDITVNPFLKTVPSRSLVPSNARHYDQSQLGYMGDDVYMFGVVYVFNDGSQSPVFHIPGRVANSVDTTPLIVVSSVAGAGQVAFSDVEHLGVQIGETVATWQVRNTGTANTMAYWEGTDEYPTTFNCDNSGFIWGDLAGRNVRGHRFPSRDVVAHARQRNNYVWGVEFQNVNYPSPDIVGHFFTRARVDNPIVQTTGYIAPTYKGNAGTIFTGELGRDPNDVSSFVIENKRQVSVITPHTLFNLPYTAQYTTHSLYTNFEGRSASNTIPIVNGFGTQFDLTHNYRYARMDEASTPLTQRNYSISRVVNLAPRLTTTVLGDTYQNYSYTIPYDIHGLNADVDYPFWYPLGTVDEMVYASFKTTADPYPSIASLEYVRISPLLTGATNQVLGGDTFIGSVSMWNVARLITRRDVFNSIKEITQQGTLVSDMFFECRFDTSLNFRADSDRTLLYFNPGDSYLTGNPSLPSYWDEGRLWLFDRSIDIAADGAYNYVEPSDYVYDYNPDMSVGQRMKSYFPLDQFYECCSTCTGLYPYRHVYSMQSFQEERSDNFRVFLANNYRDMEGQSGEITDTFRFDDIFYVVTKEGLWYLPSNIQERTNDAGIVSYLGSGEFFSLPPRKIMDVGYIEKWATTKTPVGVFLFDTLFGRSYMVNREVQPLAGVESEIRPLVGPTLNDLFGIDHNYQVGSIAAYDDENKRILVTHKDYKPLLEVGGTTDGYTGTTTSKIYYNSATARFYVYINGYGHFPISLNSTQYFCDKSFTVSYSLEDGWVGYHSYTPQIYLSGRKMLMGVKDNHLYQHNIGDFCVYYGGSYPFSLELVFKSKGLDSLQFVTYAERDGVQDRWATFDRIVVYNSHQSTTERVLIPKNLIEGPDYLPNAALGSYLIDSYQEVWSVNGFRDEVGNYNVALFETDCIDLRRGNKLLNPLAFTGKEWFELQPFTDNYVQARLLFTPRPKTKLTTLIFNEQDSRDRR